MQVEEELWEEEFIERCIQELLEEEEQWEWFIPSRDLPPQTVAQLQDQISLLVLDADVVVSSPSASANQAPPQTADRKSSETVLMLHESFMSLFWKLMELGAPCVLGGPMCVKVLFHASSLKNTGVRQSSRFILVCCKHAAAGRGV